MNLQIIHFIRREFNMLKKLLIIILLALPCSLLADGGNSDGKPSREKPIIVSSNPPNGSIAIDRNLQEIEIHFN
jgi:hypothetical protein